MRTVGVRQNVSTRQLTVNDTTLCTASSTRDVALCVYTTLSLVDCTGPSMDNSPALVALHPKNAKPYKPVGTLLSLKCWSMINNYAFH